MAFAMMGGPGGEGGSSAIKVFFSIFFIKKTILNHSLTAKTCFAHLFSDTPLDYIWRAQI